MGLFSLTAQAQNMRAYFNSAGGTWCSVPDNDALDFGSNFTIECWIYPESGGNAIRSVIAKSSSTFNNGYIFPKTDDSWANIGAYL